VEVFHITGLVVDVEEEEKDENKKKTENINRRKTT
jgi:hypothetical protein